jgi:hypothetical protein
LTNIWKGRSHRKDNYGTPNSTSNGDKIIGQIRKKYVCWLTNYKTCSQNHQQVQNLKACTESKVREGKIDMADKITIYDNEEKV